jgi:beta-glucosidase
VFDLQVGGKQQRPIKQLAGFQRVTLKPGEKQTVSFSLPHDHIALRYWDDARVNSSMSPGPCNL